MGHGWVGVGHRHNKWVTGGSPWVIVLVTQKSMGHHVGQQNVGHVCNNPFFINDQISRRLYGEITEYNKTKIQQKSCHP